jgi:hypothetical protein
VSGVEALKRYLFFDIIHQLSLRTAGEITAAFGSGARNLGYTLTI